MTTWVSARAAVRPGAVPSRTCRSLVNCGGIGLCLAGFETQSNVHMFARKIKCSNTLGGCFRMQSLLLPPYYTPYNTLAEAVSSYPFRTFERTEQSILR